MKKITLLFILLVVNITFAQKDIFEVCRSGTLAEITQIYNSDNNIINTKDLRGYSPITIACYNGNEEVVSFLISKVNNANEMSVYGTPLMATAYKGYDKIVKILLDANVNPNESDANGFTAAHYAVFNKNYKIVSLLIESKANFNLKNNVGLSALDFAMKYNDEKLNLLLNIPQD